MNRLFAQERMPLLEALEKYRANRVVPFDVPGHKQGKGNRLLQQFLGEKCLAVDVNSMKPLDNLTQPVSVIKEAEALAAKAFCAQNAFFIVNGTTAAVQAMVLFCCKRGDKIIMPRNVHISAIHALVLCGAVPVYVDPGVNKKLGISLGMAYEDVEKAILAHPDAKAVFVNNPTYYGICSDLERIASLAHAHSMMVCADEAHGAHFYFGDNLPKNAMACGADLAAVSMHKTGGSLTQSSLLLSGPSVDPGQVRQILNLTQTTSASYLLMVSLDISRRNLAVRGRETFAKVSSLATYARDEIGQIGGYDAYGPELVGQRGVYGFDTTKLSVYTRGIGLAGIEVYDLLRDEYGIQIEFGDIGNILAIISVGDSELEIERLVSALYEIKRRYQRDSAGLFDHEYINPVVERAPQDAFYANKRELPLAECRNQICGEFVMCYPPGIPILAPGERITAEILDYIAYAREKGCRITGAKDPEVTALQVLCE